MHYVLRGPTHRLRHYTSLQLALLVEKITGNWREEANKRSLPRHGPRLQYHQDRLPVLQVNAPKLPVLHSPYNLIIPPGSDVRSVLPDGHIISSRHADWSGSGLTDIPYPLQSVCQRHVLILAPFPVSPLRGRHGHHCHVTQSDAATQLPGVIHQRLSTVVERMKNRRRCL